MKMWYIKPKINIRLPMNYLEGGSVAQLENAESVEEREVVEEIRQDARRLMEERHGENAEFPKTIHSPEHPENLRRIAAKVAEILGATEHQKNVADVAIGYHDTVIKVDKPDPDKLLDFAKRHRGALQGDGAYGINGNEAESAREMLAAMEQANRTAKETIFSPEDMENGKAAIEATYPDAYFGVSFTAEEARAGQLTYRTYINEVIARSNELKQSGEVNKSVDDVIKQLNNLKFTSGPVFTQPHLETALENGEQIPDEVLIVAMSDLFAGGAEDFGEFSKGGDGEFQENRFNLSQLSRYSEAEVEELLADGTIPNRKALLRKVREDLNQEEMAAASEAMLAWHHDQVGFLAFQMIRFEKMMYLLRENGQIDAGQEKQFRHTFNKFIHNMGQAVRRYRKLKRQYEQSIKTGRAADGFYGLAQDMGYAVPEQYQT